MRNFKNLFGLFPEKKLFGKYAERKRKEGMRLAIGRRASFLEISIKKYCNVKSCIFLDFSEKQPVTEISLLEVMKFFIS